MIISSISQVMICQGVLCRALYDLAEGEKGGEERGARRGSKRSLGLLSGNGTGTRRHWGGTIASSTTTGGIDRPRKAPGKKKERQGEASTFNP